MASKPFARLVSQVMDNPLGRRLSAGFSSNLYAQASTAVMQLLAVPVLLHSWGVEVYAAWLVLTALPTYLVLADLGFATAAASELTMKANAGDLPGAITAYHSAIGMVAGSAAVLIVMTGTVVLMLPVADLLHLAISNETATATLLLLMLYVGATLIFSVIGIGMRAVHQYARLTFLMANVRLVEGLAVLAVALAGGSLIFAASVMLLVRLCGIALAVYLVRRFAPGIRPGIAQARRSVVKSLITPSLTFVSYTIGNAIAIQGITVALSTTVGAVGLVAFSSARTVARLGVQLGNSLNFPMQVEYSSAHGRGDTAQFWRSVGRHLRITTAFAVGFALAGSLLLTWFVTMWTNGHVFVPATLAGPIVLACALEMVWLAAQSPLVATNRHNVVGPAYLALSIVYFVATYSLGQSFGLVVASWGGVAVTGIMLALTMSQLLRFRHGGQGGVS